MELRMTRSSEGWRAHRTAACSKADGITDEGMDRPSSPC